LAQFLEKAIRKKGVKNVFNLAGKTSIDSLCAYISKMQLFITGDSGPMHIAAAYKIPTISLFGSTKYLETSQWKNKESVIIKRDLECQPCMKRICPLGHHNCMKLITAESVIIEAKRLFSKVKIN